MLQGFIWLGSSLKRSALSPTVAWHLQIQMVAQHLHILQGEGQVLHIQAQLLCLNISHFAEYSLKSEEEKALLASRAAHALEA